MVKNKSFWCDLDPIEGVEIVIMAALFICSIIFFFSGFRFVSEIDAYSRWGIGVVLSIFSFSSIYLRWRIYKKRS